MQPGRRTEAVPVRRASCGIWPQFATWIIVTCAPLCRKALLTRACPLRQEAEREPACVLVPCRPPGTRYPLLLLLHGYNGNGSSIESFLQLADSAPADAPIVVLPSGLVERSAGALAPDETVILLTSPLHPY